MKLFRSKKPNVPSRRLANREPRSDEISSPQYRRNQTLSGIQREKADEASSPRSKVHHLTRQRRKVGGILFIVLVGIAVLVLLLTQFTARIIMTTTNTALSAPIEGQKYEKVVNDYLSLNPAERLRFLINEDALSTYVTTAAPEVAGIKQTGAQGVAETRFTITFRRPLAGWQIDNRQYYVDDQGVVFEKNYYETPLLQIIDASGISPEQGSSVASARLLSFVGRVVGLSKESGYEVSEAILPSGTTRQLDIRLKNVSSLVKVSIDRGAGEQVEDMDRSIRYLQAQGALPGYIDVRVSGRAIYR